jgi:hypothetical protein
MLRQTLALHSNVLPVTAKKLRKRKLSRQRCASAELREHAVEPLLARRRLRCEGFESLGMNAKKIRENTKMEAGKNAWVHLIG